MIKTAKIGNSTLYFNTFLKTITFATSGMAYEYVLTDSFKEEYGEELTFENLKHCFENGKQLSLLKIVKII